MHQATIQAEKKTITSYLNRDTRIRIATIALEIGISLILVPFVFVYLFDSGFQGGALASLFFTIAMLMILVSIVIVPIDSLIRKNAPVSRKFSTAFFVIGKGLFLVFFLLSIDTMWHEPISSGAILLGRIEPETISGEVASVHASPFTILFSRELEVLQDEGTTLKFEYRYPKGIESGKSYQITIAPDTNLVLAVDPI